MSSLSTNPPDDNNDARLRLLEKAPASAAANDDDVRVPIHPCAALEWEWEWDDPSSTRQTHAAPPAAFTALRLCVAIAAAPLACLLCAIAGALIAPSILVRSRRRLWAVTLGARGTNARRSQGRWRSSVFTLGLAIGALLASALGLVAGALGGIAAAFLRALFGPGAPCEPLAIGAARSEASPPIPAPPGGGIVESGCVLVRRDGRFIRLHVSVRRPLHPPKALLVYHHGLHSHGGTGNNVALADAFVAAGFAVALPDALAHGRSAGEGPAGGGGPLGIAGQAGGRGGRTLVRSFEALAGDLACVLAAACTLFPSPPSGEAAPLFVMGESLGGLLTLLASSRPLPPAVAERLQGVLATCPAIDIHADTGDTWADALVPFLPLQVSTHASPFAAFSSHSPFVSCA